MANNKVQLADGTVLVDLTDTTATASDVAAGKYFYNASGVKTAGTASGGTGAISVVDTTDSHGGTVRTITAIDISDTTAVASDVAQGKYFYMANGTKTQGTASSGGSVLTETGTFSGSGGITAQISCNFAPDLIYIFGDLSSSTSLRGVISLTILKDIALYMTSDVSQSAIQENLYRAVHGISSYNENNQNDEPYASYSNGVLSINTVENTSTARFASGVTYSYKLVGWS